MKHCLVHWHLMQPHWEGTWELCSVWCVRWLHHSPMKWSRKRCCSQRHKSQRGDSSQNHLLILGAWCWHETQGWVFRTSEHPLQQSCLAIYLLWRVLFLQKLDCQRVGIEEFESATITLWVILGWSQEALPGWLRALSILPNHWIYPLQIFLAHCSH